MSPAAQGDEPAIDAAMLLRALVQWIGARPDNDQVWLLLAAISGVLPTRDDVDEARRRLELIDLEGRAAFLLDTGLRTAESQGTLLTRVELVQGSVLVDVDFAAQNDLHTGVQRVVRQTVPLWFRQHDVTPLVWTGTRTALRRLDTVESTRVLDWARREQERLEPAHSGTAANDVIVLPWRCVVVLFEVPPEDVALRIAALGSYSGNVVVAVGHDAIPLVSADTVDYAEPRRYMAYLSALKYAARIAGVSRASTREFSSYGAMLSTQGLTPPVTVAVPLAVDFGTPQRTDVSSAPVDDAAPTLVVVGSHDTRKNHMAVLHAAEVLWQEGLRFRLQFLGGGGSNDAFFKRVEILQRRGREVQVRVAVSDRELQSAVSAALFTIFPSLHEGFGLPVAESLSLGVPVVTTNYGATAEIASEGGVLTIDPRSNTALADAMRRLLTDDSEIARLRDEIVRRPERNWQTYADELWTHLVAPCLG